MTKKCIQCDQETTRVVYIGRTPAPQCIDCHNFNKEKSEREASAKTRDIIQKSIDAGLLTAYAMTAILGYCFFA